MFLWKEKNMLNPIFCFTLGDCFTTTSDKGKAIPLQAWTDPEGSRRLRVPDFKTIGT